MKHAWGAQAVTLGVWEALAYTGVVPPVSRAYKGARSRWGRRAELALALWLFGLARHLLAPLPRPTEKRTIGTRG